MASVQAELISEEVNEMATDTRQDEFISEARAAARMVWEGTLRLQGLQPEHTAQDYGSAGNLEPRAGGANEGITAAQVGAAVFATADAIRTLLNTGHATNLTALL